MANFPTFPPPSYGSSTDKQFRILENNFGDGYTQRAGDGLNNGKSTWSLTWENADASVVETFKAFLDARKGYESFTWTPPNEIVALKWICRTYSATPVATGISNFTATFEQVFDL